MVTRVSETAFLPQKDCCRLLLPLRQNQRYFTRLLDSLTIAWHGKSSGELQFSDDLKSD
jgi:hypothetical protein